MTPDGRLQIGDTVTDECQQVSYIPFQLLKLDDDDKLQVLSKDDDNPLKYLPTISSKSSDANSLDNIKKAFNDKGLDICNDGSDDNVKNTFGKEGYPLDLWIKKHRGSGSGNPEYRQLLVLGGDCSQDTNFDVQFTNAPDYLQRGTVLLTYDHVSGQLAMDAAMNNLQSQVLRTGGFDNDPKTYNWKLRYENARIIVTQLTDVSIGTRQYTPKGGIHKNCGEGDGGENDNDPNLYGTPSESNTTLTLGSGDAGSGTMSRGILDGLSGLAVPVSIPSFSAPTLVTLQWCYHDGTTVLIFACTGCYNIYKNCPLFIEILIPFVLTIEVNP